MLLYNGMPVAKKPSTKTNKAAGRAKKTVVAEPVRIKARKPAAPVTKGNRKPLQGKWPPDAKRVAAVLRGLADLYPKAECELVHKNAFELLCATILSAQCTDERVNKVTPQLFTTFPDAAAMAAAPPPVVEDIIKTTGFFRQKTKSLVNTATLLMNGFGGEVPRTVEELLTLKGVARKTSNVVLGTAYGIAVGVVVDTHVQRLALRMALTRNITPEKIEQDLMAIVPQNQWIDLSHRLIWHGRRQCFARKPACETCPLVPHCPSAFQEN